MSHLDKIAVTCMLGLPMMYCVYITCNVCTMASVVASNAYKRHLNIRACYFTTELWLMYSDRCIHLAYSFTRIYSVPIRSDFRRSRSYAPVATSYSIRNGWCKSQHAGLLLLADPVSHSMFVLIVNERAPNKYWAYIIEYGIPWIRCGTLHN